MKPIRILRGAPVLLWLAACAVSAQPRTEPAPPPGAGRDTARSAEKRGVRGSMAQLRDAWLASDAAVFGTYRGVDPALGERYRVLEVEEVWLGSPARGRLVFKAPRGVRAEPGDRVLLLLWDRLGSASNSYLEESKARFGSDLWTAIGPDSLAPYLLPFPNYAFAFEKNKLVLRGTGAFLQEIERGDLRRQLQDYEFTLLPQNLYRTADAVVRARVRDVQVLARKNEDIVVEYRVQVNLVPLETLKGSVPNPLALEYASFPRSPRFEKDDEVILFLSRVEGALFLKHGKRSVLHVAGGEVLEAGRPLSEFLKTLRGS